MNKIISCQITLIPVDQHRYGEIIAHVLSQWDTTGVQVETGPMSTVVIGEQSLVWNRVQAMFELAQQHHHKIIMQALFSDCCICEV